MRYYIEWKYIGLSKYERKGMITKMICINKEEKEAIQARFPDVHIVRTMKQKSKRHRYYCEETRGVVGLLRRLRGGSRSQETSGRGARHAD